MDGCWKEPCPAFHDHGMEMQETLAEYWMVGDKASLEGGQEKQGEDCSRILHQNEDEASPKWKEIRKHVSLQEKQKVGRHYEQKRWMVYPLRSYINLFSTSYFPVCIQRKKLLTNRQKTILIINLYTDKQDRSQQRLWEIIPDKCLYTGAKPKVAQGQTNSRAIQMRKSALSACHFWCSCAAARTWTITPIPPPAPQN